MIPSIEPDLKIIELTSTPLLASIQGGDSVWEDETPLIPFNGKW